MVACSEPFITFFPVHAHMNLLISFDCSRPILTPGVILLKCKSEHGIPLLKRDVILTIYWSRLSNIHTDIVILNSLSSCFYTYDVRLLPPNSTSVV